MCWVAGLSLALLCWLAAIQGSANRTLLLQCAGGLATGDASVLYVTAEESEQQVKLRADRLGISDRELYLYSETEIESVIDAARRLKPDVIVVDSIQTVFSSEITSAAGSVSQVRDCTARLMDFAKSGDTAVFVVGHVTKEGSIAGPRVLEHMVDAVLYLEGDRFHQYRILRAVKNRFGSIDEVGVFEMVEAGMREVANPSEAFLEERSGNASGSAVTVTVEGTRPILVEVPGPHRGGRLWECAPDGQWIRIESAADACGGPSAPGRDERDGSGHFRERCRWPPGH